MKKNRGRIPVFLLCILFFLAVVAVIVAPDNTVLAQATPQPYVPLAPLPGTTGPGGATLQTYLPGMFKLAIGIAGVLAVIQIVIGGLQYMTTDIISSKSAARERITAAITGLLLALGAYILLNTISPNLVKFNLNIKPVEVKYTPPATAQGLSLGSPCVGAPPTPAGACAEGMCMKNPLSFSSCAPAIGSESGRCVTMCPAKVAHGGTCTASIQCEQTNDLCRIPAEGCRQVRGDGEPGQCLDVLCQ